MSFLDLPWEDVVFPMILPCLPLKTLFTLRRVSSKGKITIDTFLTDEIFHPVGYNNGWIVQFKNRSVPHVLFP